MFDEIRIAAAQQFAAEQRNPNGGHESTPEEISDAVVRFADSLGSEPARFVPVVADGYGLFGWCIDGVNEKVRAMGGAPVLGWAIWEWPTAMLTAEFHCVWADPTGELFDITPKPKGQTRIVFVPDYSYPANFNFDERPRNRRMRIWPDTDKAALAIAHEAGLSDSQRAYESRRATKAGILLLQWLERKIPDAPMVVAVDEAIAACGAFEEHYDSLGMSGPIRVDDRYHALARRREAALNALKLLCSKGNQANGAGR